MLKLFVLAQAPVVAASQGFDAAFWGQIILQIVGAIGAILALIKSSKAAEKSQEAAINTKEAKDIVVQSAQVVKQVETNTNSAASVLNGKLDAAYLALTNEVESHAKTQVEMATAQGEIKKLTEQVLARGGSSVVEKPVAEPLTEEKMVELIHRVIAGNGKKPT